MGDVAMTVPVLKQLLNQYPQLEITLISNAAFEPMFAPLERCHFLGADLKGKHKGMVGLYNLFKTIQQRKKIDAVADLHSVLRSNVLKFYCKLAGYKTATIDKGRKEKKALTQQTAKDFKQLPTGFERYAAVFSALGFPVQLNQSEKIFDRRALPHLLKSIFQAGMKTIGIAPFAQHEEKMYPLEKMKTIVQVLSQSGIKILLFGGRGNEATILKEWEIEISKNVQCIAGRFSFQEELNIISHLDLMCSMDSANMHLASLYNVPVVSIWGATHPFAGFYGWGQSPQNIVSIDLACRPCSVFGNKPCYRGDHACMQQIETIHVVEKIKNLLSH
jgi:hypothetical protein